MSDSRARNAGSSGSADAIDGGSARTAVSETRRSLHIVGVSFHGCTAAVVRR